MNAQTEELVKFALEKLGYTFHQPHPSVLDPVYFKGDKMICWVEGFCPISSWDLMGEGLAACEAANIHVYIGTVNMEVEVYRPSCEGPHIQAKTVQDIPRCFWQAWHQLEASKTNKPVT